MKIDNALVDCKTN